MPAKLPPGPRLPRTLQTIAWWNRTVPFLERCRERPPRGGPGRDRAPPALGGARHEDGSPMSPLELRDELMTLLVAGHETTASELAWAFERLTRTPGVLARLTDEIDAGDEDAYVTATVHETLRRRPVLPNAAPRLVMEPVEIGGWRYEPGVCLLADAYLVHHDPDVYPDPYAFRPERFLDEQPGTYTWIPYGVRLWDGSTLAPTNGGGPTFEVRSPDAFAHALLAPGQLGLGRAYVSGALDVDDLEGTLELLDEWQPPAIETPTKARLMLAAARAF